ncbi:MAG: DUF559 domain-containing protein [Cyclobacteriaceae bacterium]
MRSNYKRLESYIRPIDIRNTELEVDLLLGVSIKKILMPSIANTIGTDMSKYKIIRKMQFAYGPVTSRNGDKISVALLEDHEAAILSQAYVVFEVIDHNELDPEYLMMWFRRPEFDRYARFKSHGSARETFDWEEMCETELPIPSIEKQRAIVKEYNTVVNRIKLNEQLNQKLEETAQALYKHWFVDFEFPHSPSLEGSAHQGVNSPPLEGSSKRGVVNISELESSLNKEVVTTSESEKSSKKKVIERNSKNYFSLPFNPKLKDRAKALRKAGNLSEVLFWQEVRNKQFRGLDFDRQKIIGNYIVDFYCPNCQVVVEIDGSSHDDKQEYDAARDAYLEGLGLTVIHIDDLEVKKRLKSLMNELYEHPAFEMVDGGEMRSEEPPRPAGTPPEEGNMSAAKGYKSSGGKMVWNEELEKEIPEGWEVDKMINRTTKIGSGSTPRGGKGSYQQTGISLIRSMNVHDFQFLFKDLAFIDKQQADKLKNVEVEENDILLNITGASVARCSIVPKDVLPARVNQHVAIIRMNEIESSNYILCALCSTYYKKRLLGVSESGSTREAITKEDIQNFEMLFPNHKVLDQFDYKLDLILKNREMATSENEILISLKDLILSKMTQVEVEEKEVVG